MGSERRIAGDADELEDWLTAESLAQDDPTSWFERFYRAGANGEVELQRYPGSAVRYQTADLLDPPSEWLRAFDLVVEIITVQALPNPHQRRAIVNVGRLAAPGGTLLAVAAVRDEHERHPGLGPWALSRTDVAAFGTDGLVPVRVDVVAVPGGPEDLRWRAEFRRPGA